MTASRTYLLNGDRVAKLPQPATIKTRQERDEALEELRELADLYRRGGSVKMRRAVLSMTSRRERALRALDLD